MYLILIATILLSIETGLSKKPPGPGHFYGAWSITSDDASTDISYIKIYTPRYFVYSQYDDNAKSFIEAAGGTWALTDQGIEELYEFHSANPEIIGKTLLCSLDNHDQTFFDVIIKHSNEDRKEHWTQVDKGESPLFGAWRITQRERDGEMTTMRQGPRKTLKILSGSRFQWAAYNVETRQFSATGGGTYSTNEGEYIENIAFFSRDSTRIGMSLSFKFEVADNNWDHRGFSSKGSPIHEIWTNQD